MTTTDNTMTPQYRLATAPAFVGRDLGVSEWVAVDQNRIDQFAACTGDRQWIHVDVDRARRESLSAAPWLPDDTSARKPSSAALTGRHWRPSPKL